MPTSSDDHGQGPRRGGPDLRGRGAECEVLDQLLADVRGGDSRALVLRGDAGIGKTALLDYLVRSAGGCRIARAVGIESEMELAFASLHQLCTPCLGHLDRLPGPQREALGTAFGLRAGGAPDRFHVGLAVLTLLAEAAEAQPLVCVVDDAQWLDDASLQTLAFVARRLVAESIALVFALREPVGEHPLVGLPELVIHGLDDDEARALLRSVVIGPVDERVRDRIVAETHGNPLALLELPRGLTPEELAGGFGLPDAPGLTGRIEDGFRRRLERLPAPTRRLLLVAAAEPVGDPGLVWRAAAKFDVGYIAATPAVSAGLVDFAGQVRFQHPLVRSAVYRAASPDDRREAHRALADVTDPGLDPDRRAWHRAHATAEPDDAVADELERSADRAQTRGGLAAAAALLEEAARLTRDPSDRGRRALAAAQTKQQAGLADAALSLLAVAEASPLDQLQRARAGLLRAELASDLHRGNDALYNGMGRYAEAFEAAKLGCAHDDLGIYEWSLGELVEAAARSGQQETAIAAVEKLATTARIAGTDWAQGVEAGCRALISDDTDAEALYREALDRLGRTRIRIGLARNHLVYGEWLRRRGRRVDAREQLRTAHQLFADMGADGFAERARRELLATGEKVRKRSIATRDQLTAQEAQIARLVNEGRTNPEIAAELFISPRTVEWHLRKVFSKLGVSSRRELRASRRSLRIQAPA